MLKTKLKKLITKHHYWRDISFTQLTELYFNRFLTVTGTSIIGIFIPIYLYRSGMSVPGISLYFAFFYLTRSLSSVVAANMIAKVGPKHTMIVGQLLQVVAFLMLLSPKVHSVAVYTIAIISGLAANFYFMAFHIDFSKCRIASHGGKEVSASIMFEKLGGVFGPFVGGLVATYAQPKYTIIAAIVFMFLALVPLLMSPDNQIRKSKLDWSNLGSNILTDHLKGAGFVIDAAFSTTLWPLFVALSISTGGVYVLFGSSYSLSVLVSMLSLGFIGRRLDNNSTNNLIKYGVIANSCVHILRFFANSSAIIYLVNLVNEPATQSYRVAYIKQSYDRSDQFDAQRVEYFAAMSCSGFFVVAVLWSAIAMTSQYFDPRSIIKITFIFSAFATMLIALKYKKAKS
jgi:hypothetical protein